MDILCHVRHDIRLHQVVSGPWEALGSLFDTKNCSVQLSCLVKSFLPTVFFNVFQLKNTFVCKLDIALLMPNILHFFFSRCFLIFLNLCFSFSVSVCFSLLCMSVEHRHSCYFLWLFFSLVSKQVIKVVSSSAVFYHCQRCEWQACWSLCSLHGWEISAVFCIILS